jgi:hypothetical protein
LTRELVGDEKTNHNQKKDIVYSFEVSHSRPPAKWVSSVSYKKCNALCLRNIPFHPNLSVKEQYTSAVVS